MTSFFVYNSRAVTAFMQTKGMLSGNPTLRLRGPRRREELQQEQTRRQRHCQDPCVLLNLTLEQRRFVQHYAIFPLSAFAERYSTRL